jgi:hypothetical protein
MKIYKIWIGPYPEPEHFKKYTDTWHIISDAQIVSIGNVYINKIQVKGNGPTF